MEICFHIYIHPLDISNVVDEFEITLDDEALMVAHIFFTR